MPAKKYFTEEERQEARREACRRWRSAHPEKQAAATKSWFDRNPEAVERYRAAKRKGPRKKKPRIEVEAKRKAWRKANPEKIAAYRKKWNEANPEQLAAIRVASNHKRGVVKVSGDLTAEQWYEILEAFQDRCAYCLTEGKMEPDHIVPIRDGGEHAASNIVPACRRCNASKGAKSLLTYLMAS